MYNNIKLDKSLYKLSGKSFTQALSEMDPDAAYAGTELEGLDAFERQLKRFNIKVSGDDCDIVDKFFTCSESAVLFPEYIRRAILSGMQSPVLDEVVAVDSIATATDYRGFTVTLVGDAPYSTLTNEGAALPETKITQSAAITPSKLGRVISTSYEAIRYQKLELFACTLRSIGAQLGNEITKIGINTLVTGASTVSGTSGGFTFADLLALYQAFANYDLTTLVASPATCAALLALSQLSEATSDDGGESVKLPFGPTLFKAKAYTGTGVIGIDRKFALEMITQGGIILETDKLIDKQLDRIAVSVGICFKKVIDDAVKVLTYTE